MKVQDYCRIARTVQVRDGSCVFWNGKVGLQTKLILLIRNHFQLKEDWENLHVFKDNELYAAEKINQFSFTISFRDYPLVIKSLTNDFKILDKGAMLICHRKY